ncbi:PiggyBac transposable element-derived protein 4, partial [Elysia marginata]
ALRLIRAVRKNRLPGCDLKTDKALKKEGRGALDFRVKVERKIVAVRCMDTKCVTLLSSHIGVQPVEDVSRWDKTKKCFGSVPRPNVVKVYNEFIGGVDYLDRMCAKSRFHIRSKRWYMHIFWFTTKIAVANAWIIYRRKGLAMEEAKKNIMMLKKFQAYVATCLMKSDATKKNADLLKCPENSAAWNDPKKSAKMAQTIASRSQLGENARFARLVFARLNAKNAMSGSASRKKNNCFDKYCCYIFLAFNSIACLDSTCAFHLCYLLFHVLTLGPGLQYTLFSDDFSAAWVSWLSGASIGVSDLQQSSESCALIDVGGHVAFKGCSGSVYLEDTLNSCWLGRSDLDKVRPRSN